MPVIDLERIEVAESHSHASVVVLVLCHLAFRLIELATRLKWLTPVSIDTDKPENCEQRNETADVDRGAGAWIGPGIDSDCEWVTDRVSTEWKWHKPAPTASRRRVNCCSLIDLVNDDWKTPTSVRRRLNDEAAGLKLYRQIHVCDDVLIMLLRLVLLILFDPRRKEKLD